MVNKIMSAFISVLLAFSVLLIAFGVSRDVPSAWGLGCICLGVTVHMVIDHCKHLS